MRIIKQDDLRVDVVHAVGGDYLVYRHVKLGSSLRCALDQAVQGGEEFILQIMRSIVMDVGLAAKVSTEAEGLVLTARALNVEGLVEWLESESTDEVLIAVFELARRGAPTPQEILYANHHAMRDPIIRGYLLRGSAPSTAR